MISSEVSEGGSQRDLDSNTGMYVYRLTKLEAESVFWLLKCGICC